jgi:hypothetical protein
MEAWRKRMVDAIKADGRSYREISLKAKLGPNYVTQLLAPNSRGPTVSAFVKLLGVIKASPVYILTGAEMTADAEELLQLAALMDETTRARFVEFLRAQLDREQTPKRLPGPEPKDAPIA